MTTKDYQDKRDFRKTGEPRGDDEASGDHPLFVIQEHDASTLHYDFRLELDGVLRSWAVPKGPSTDPSERRLAIPTEDHPLGYADFEGVIPEGEYGAGTVLVWDRGPYENVTGEGEDRPSLAKALGDGHAVVKLNGEKLHGAWALQRTDTGDDERWLLVKVDDDDADARRNPVSTEPESVLSGRTRDEIAAEGTN